MRNLKLSLLIVFLIFVALDAEIVYAAQLEKRPVGQQKEAEGGSSTPSSYYADLARIHARYGKWDEAEECLKKAIELETEPAVVADLACQLAKVYVQDGDADKAEAMYEFALERTPNEQAIVTRAGELARLYAGRQQHDNASAIYHRLLKASDPNVRRQLEQEYFRFCKEAGTLDVLIGEYQTKLEGGADAGVFQSLAELHRLNNDTDGELEIYRKWREAFPESQQALFLLASAYREAGEFDEAASAFEKLTEMNPQGAQFYIAEIIRLNLQAGKTDDTEIWIRKLLNGPQGETAAAHAMLAGIYAGQSMHDEAIFHYAEAAELTAEPRQKAEHLIQLAQAYEKAGRFQDAEDMLRGILDSGADSRSLRRAQMMLEQIQRAGQDQ